MQRSLYIALIVSILSLSAGAQDFEQIETGSRIFNQLFSDDAYSGEVQLIQEKKLDEILMLFMDQNRKLGGIPCYWIRIYSGSGHNSREEANLTKARFLNKYEGIRIKVIYDDPNFKVYVGGYRSKSETLKVLNTIKKDFRNPFMVNDVIDFPEKPRD